MEDVISLGIGEPDFVSPSATIEAAVASLRAGQTGYTPNMGIRELRERIAEQISRLYHVSYDPDTEIIITVGVSEALQLAFLALLDPGDEILIPEPCFVSYGPAAMFAGAEVVYVPTYARDRFEVTPEALESRITPRTKAILLQYPANPTGAVMRRASMEAVAEIIRRHDLLVVSDEIYGQLIYGAAHTEGHVCVPSVDGLRERSVLLGGFSKTYAMTGWRVGYACAPASVLSAIYKLHQYIIMSASTMGQVAAIAALEHCEEDVEMMRSAYDRRRRLIVDGLNAVGLPTFEPEGAFYCFPDIRPTGLTSTEFAQRLLHEERVACIPGDAFGPSGSGYVRCSYASSENNIRIALERIAHFLERNMPSQESHPVHPS